MTWRHRPGRARATARSGLGFGSVARRENNLLSPHRCRRRGGNPHDGEIITHAPNLMWGTDGFDTVDDGWGWIFTARALERRVCRLAVCKRGDRFAALQPISICQAVWLGGAARGLALRMDHGSQYLSDHFTNQIKFWGIQPSYAFVAEPQTNGVAERFNRTLKEQIIHGRIYRNIAELRDAVRDFVELAQWRRKEQAKFEGNRVYNDLRPRPAPA